MSMISTSVTIKVSTIIILRGRSIGKLNMLIPSCPVYIALPLQIYIKLQLKSLLCWHDSKLCVYVWALVNR